MTKRDDGEEANKVKKILKKGLIFHIETHKGEGEEGSEGRKRGRKGGREREGKTGTKTRGWRTGGGGKTIGGSFSKRMLRYRISCSSLCSAFSSRFTSYMKIEVGRQKGGGEEEEE